MALTATIYNLIVDLADIDRGVYEKLDVCVARQPSETIEYMFMRVIAYCLEYGDGIELTQGVAAGNDPAVLIRDLTGRVTAMDRGRYARPRAFASRPETRRPRSSLYSPRRPKSACSTFRGQDRSAVFCSSV